LRQTQTFEPIDQIVSQQNQMKMNLIGQKTVARNVAQREAFFGSLLTPLGLINQSVKIDQLVVYC
jgi:hypothetical protein